MINVIVNGVLGKMGAESGRAIDADPGLDLVAGLDVGADLALSISQHAADVVLDFTNPTVVRQNVETIIDAGAHAVVGTTGLSETDLAELDARAKVKGVGVLVCPNFAIGAVLMMEFAAKAAQYMPHVEIIEYHHNQKADAPSGTAIKTADLIAESNPQVNVIPLVETELVKGARGGTYKNIPIHSVRLPGYVAHQEVILGGLGQTLRIRHDSIDRESFMPGVCLAIKKVASLTGLTYGLEKVL
ncbi:MAG: 4-hydroxy-tetrahydrodipicolinate reductase [bacterium]|nr:4-hydroxy-tetrahydrodipicolinate reductase [bacterium]